MPVTRRKAVGARNRLRYTHAMAFTAERHVQIGFSILFLVLCVIGAMSYYSVTRLREDADWISHTHEVIAAVNSIASDVAEAVSAERGFALTGDKAYLGQHDAAARTVQGGFGMLTRLVGDNPAQLERVKNVNRLVMERMAFVRGVNELYRNEGIDAVRAMLAKGAGRTLSERIAAAMDELEAAERALLSERSARAARVTTRAKAVILAGVALALMSLVLALYLLSRDFAGRRRAEAALHASMNELDARVRDRTTELAHANKALLDSEERLRGVIQSAMDAIITIDAEQRIVVFNETAAKMFRCRAEEAIGSPLERFIPERFRAAHRGHVERFGETGATARRMGARIELFGLRADGEEFPIDASISQVTVDGEKFYTVILRDVSERRRAEEALERSYSELRELSAVMNEVREAERTRVARELHDELAQWLTALKMDIAWLSVAAAAGERGVLDRTERMRKVVDTTVASVRRIAADLRPVMLDDLGLVPSIENLLQALRRTREPRGQAGCSRATDSISGIPSPRRSTAWSRKRSRTWLVMRRQRKSALRLPGKVTRCRTHRGQRRGARATSPGRKSYGVLGIRERAQTLGGQARDLQPGEGGTVVEISIPLARFTGAEAVA